MGYSEFFNLIATVIRSAITDFSFTEAGILEKDDLKTLNREIDDTLKKLINYSPGITHDKIRWDSEICDDIIKWVKEKKDKYLYLHLLMRLDHMVNIDTLCLDYGIKATAIRNRERKEKENPGTAKGKYVAPYFSALNINVEETGILVLPDFRIPTENDDVNEEAKEISRMSGLNDILHSLSFLKTEELSDGFCINNVILDPGRSFEQMSIAFTPTTNKAKTEAFSVGEKVIEQEESGHKFVYMGEITLQNKEDSTENYLKCLEYSRKQKIDILVGTEMFGTEALCRTGASGVNPLFVDDENRNSPFLIVTPSLWKDSSNSLSVFTSRGELIGKQYKQYPYAWKGEQSEHLADVPREILLIHIKGLGKVAFPICFDLLNANYRDLLIHKLKTDFLICISYSSVSTDFEMKVMEAVSVGSYAFWFNSCSAIRGKEDEYIGYVAIPSKHPSETVQKIVPCDCEADCGSCLINVTVPAKRTERLGIVEDNIIITRTPVQNFTGNNNEKEASV